MDQLHVIVLYLIGGQIVIGEYSEEIYRAVESNSLSDAIELTLNLKNSEGIIKKTVDELLSNEINNIIEYGYKIWTAGEKDIVINNFPRAFKLIYNEDEVKITHVKFNMSLKVDMSLDSYNDRLIWGSGTPPDERRLKWRFEPVFINDKVLFKLKNIERSSYMKLHSRSDFIGDREAWVDGISVSLTRLVFILEPIYTNSDLKFFIVSDEFKQPLKLAESTDDYNDRKLWGHNGGYRTNPMRFGWKITKTMPSIFNDIVSKIRYQPPMTQDLYNTITEGLYDKAVNKTRDIMKINKKIIIRVVLNLLEDGVKNVMPYAYRLWIMDQKDVLSKCFPKVFTSLFNQTPLGIINVKYLQPLKVDVTPHRDGDRQVWGDGTNAPVKRLKWSFIPIWEHNRVHFKIKHIEYNMFLKLAVKTDSYDDREAWADALNVAEERLIWSLEPHLIGNQLSFYIVDQNFGLGLKLAVSPDSYNDRKLWGHYGNSYEDDRLKWTLQDLDPVV